MFIMIFLPITRFEPRTSRVEVTALPTEPQPLSNLPSYLWPYYVDWISLSSLGTCFERTTKIKEKLLFSVFWLSQDFRFGDFFLGQEIGVKNLKSSKLDPSINQEKKNHPYWNELTLRALDLCGYREDLWSRSCGFKYFF